METVLAGIDPSSTNDDPLRWAADYSGLVGAELVGVVAFQPSQAELPPADFDEETTGIRKLADARLDETAPSVPHRTDLRIGDPRSALEEAATDDRASTVVVGARGDGGFHHLGWGTVAHHVAHHLVVPLVVVRSPEPLEGGTIVVGLDGSPGDVSTLHWAARLAEAADGSVCAVYACDPMAMSFPHPDGVTVAEQAEAEMRQQVAAVRAKGIDVRSHVEVDDPIGALTKVADDLDAPLVVVGRRGAGHLGGLFLGRVPAELPFVAHRSVAIVPRATWS